VIAEGMERRYVRQYGTAELSPRVQRPLLFKQWCVIYDRPTRIWKGKQNKCELANQTGAAHPPVSASDE